MAVVVAGVVVVAQPPADLEDLGRRYSDTQGSHSDFAFRFQTWDFIGAIPARMKSSVYGIHGCVGF